MPLIVGPLVLGDLHDNDNNHHDDDYDECNNACTVPLLASCSAGLLYCAVELSVCFCDMVINLVASLFDLHDCGLLLDDSGLEILEELCECDHVALNLLNLVVTTSDAVGDRLSLATAITVDQLGKTVRKAV